MTLDEIDGVMEAAFRLEMSNRLKKLSDRLSDLEGKRGAHHELHLGMDGRLRKLEAGLLGLKDRLDTINGRITALEEDQGDDKPLSGCRETAWVVRYDCNPPEYLAGGSGSLPSTHTCKAAFGTFGLVKFPSRLDLRLQAILQTLGGTAVYVYTDTMEEVPQ